MLGHSWGGLLAQAYTAAHGDRVRSLALSSSSLGVGSDWKLTKKEAFRTSRQRAIGALLLVTLSQQAASATARRAPYFSATGALLRALRDQASLAGVLAFYIGAFMYYWIFFQAGLVPRWLSWWGLAGVVQGFAAAVLVLFRVTGYMSALQVLLNIPIGVNEMVLAVWLIVKGFSSPATDLRPPVSGTGLTRAAPAPMP